VEEFYESRFIKIAQTMRDIDRIGATMIEALGCCEMFPQIETHIEALAEAAKRKCEILRTDPAVFEVWPAFVVAGERLAHFQPALPHAATRAQERFAKKGQRLILDGITLVSYITRARVPMAKSTGQYLDRCERYVTAQRSAPVEPPELAGVNPKPRP
jgi:hypothetical protein